MRSFKKGLHILLLVLVILTALSVGIVQAQDGRAIKIGYVSPQTGPLAASATASPTRTARRKWLPT
jgi:hypothetical protein